MQDSQLNVAYGYLSIVLGNLCENELIRDKVRLRLPDQRLDALIQAIEEFIFYHKRLDSVRVQGEEGQDLSVDYIARMQSTVDRLQQANL